jgi:DNA repair protein RecN (Recombination protein N)
MLATLRIKNLALVSDLTLDLQPGYNVITGETGAGKSILIGALNLVLGERADRNLIRSGSDSCSVEAVFDIRDLKSPLQTYLDENGLEPCEEAQLVLKRTFSSNGSNRQFVNGSPTTLAVLATIGQWLVDIHGPHDHQSLLHSSRQLSILDAFGGLQKRRDAFSQVLERRSKIEAEKAALIVDERTYAQQVDLLRFQVNEIKSANLRADEEQEVEQEYQRASNASKLLQLCQSAQDVLSESDSALLTQGGALGRVLHDLQRVDASTANLLSLHEQATSSLRELQGELSHYADRIDVDPGRLNELEERLNSIHALKRKYGSTLADVIAFGDEAGTKLKQLEQRDAEVARLNCELDKINSELWRVGKELSSERRKLIPRLSKAVVKQLNDLGFKQSHFDVAISPPTDLATAAISQSGFDSVEFQFAPNPGEPPRALRAIASSGEMARVMLALKTVLAAEDEVPVLVFDEVDANVGGETATTVGEKMLQISENRQVLCITHLPAVAASATAHFVVSKEIKCGRTTSEVRLLDSKDRVTELARMLGGQSEPAIAHAQSLLSPKRRSGKIPK